MPKKTGSKSGSVSVSQGQLITPQKGHGRSGRNTTERHRRRKERFFRFILRRRPCYIAFFVQIGLTVTFVFSFTLLLTQHHRFVREKDRLALHDEIYEAAKTDLTLLHCEYKERAPFDTSECSYRCDDDAFIFQDVAIDRSPSKKAETCTQKFELLECSQVRKCAPDYESWNKTEIIQTACLGKNHGYMRNHHVAVATIPKVPKLTITEEVLGKEIFMNELIAVCPRCRVRTQWIKKQKLIRCVRNLETVQEGWPWDYRFCNYVERGSCEEVKLDLNQDGEDNY